MGRKMPKYRFSMLATKLSLGTRRRRFIPSKSMGRIGLNHLTISSSVIELLRRSMQSCHTSLYLSFCVILVLNNRFTLGDKSPETVRNALFQRVMFFRQSFAYIALDLREVISAFRHCKDVDNFIKIISFFSCIIRIFSYGIEGLIFALFFNVLIM